MNHMEQLLAKEAIVQLQARCCQAMSEQNWDDWQDCFTDDAEMVVAGSSATGAAEIRKMVEAATASLPGSYQATLTEITLTSDTDAQCVWAATFSQAGGQMSGMGLYRETFRKVAGKWRVSRCEPVTYFA
jgi:uncharacterized protein (TIGR02246 family)